MLTHNSENEVTCEFCGKKYANRKKYRSHKERIHSQKVIECEKCPLTFTRKQHHEAHLVRDHGEERKYCCQYCGARFIQEKHCDRHVKNFHEKTNNPRTPQRRERSANKRPYKQSFTAPGQDMMALPAPEMQMNPPMSTLSMQNPPGILYSDAMLFSSMANSNQNEQLKRLKRFFDN